MLKIALPKGRLGEKVYKFLESYGYGCEGILEDNRKLIFTDEGNGVSYFWVKPSDVSVYVERGAADIGFVGKDILMEYKSDVYELMDLDIGKCRMCIAGKRDFEEDLDRPLKVATKFENVALDYFRERNRDIEIIKLHGSIELAPIIGMSDVIVDIVETGKTLEENNMCVLKEMFPISTRLVANKSSYKFKNDEILTLVERFKLRG